MISICEVSAFPLTDNSLMTRQDPAVPYPYPNIGLDRHALEHERVIYPVCIILSFVRVFSTGPFPCRTTKEMTPLAVLPRVLSKLKALPRLPFLVHWLTRTPVFADQRLKIFDNSPAAACSIRIHRLIWFAWNQALSAGTRWLSYLKWQSSSEAAPRPLCHRSTLKAQDCARVDAVTMQQYVRIVTCFSRLSERSACPGFCDVIAFSSHASVLCRSFLPFDVRPDTLILCTYARRLSTNVVLQFRLPRLQVP